MDILAKKHQRFETTVFIPDVHYPYHDEESLKTVLNFLSDIQPDYVVQLGDLVDMWQLSDFDRNPSRITSLQADIDQARGFWRSVRKVCPKSQLIMVTGN